MIVAIAICAAKLLEKPSITCQALCIFNQLLYAIKYVFKYSFEYIHF